MLLDQFLADRSGDGTARKSVGPCGRETIPQGAGAALTDYQKEQAIALGAATGPAWERKVAGLCTSPVNVVAEESGNTAGLAIHRIDGWESRGKAGNRRPKHGPNLAKREARGLSSQGESRSDAVGPDAGTSARTLVKASKRFEARDSLPRVSASAIALTLAAFFVLALLASCITVNGRSSDTYRPRELR